MLYALHAGLGVLLDEGLEASWARHAQAGAQLQAALPELGFRLFAEERRLPQLTSVWLPEGVDDAKVRGELLRRFDVEVGGGLGDLAGKGWRIAHSTAEPQDEEASQSVRRRGFRFRAFLQRTVGWLSLLTIGWVVASYSGIERAKTLLGQIHQLLLSIPPLR